MVLLVLEVFFRGLMFLRHSDKILCHGDSLRSPLVLPTKQHANIAEKVLGFVAACQPGVSDIPRILKLSVLFAINDLHVQMRHRPFILGQTFLLVRPHRKRPGS